MTALSVAFSPDGRLRDGGQQVRFWAVEDGLVAGATSTIYISIVPAGRDFLCR